MREPEPARTGRGERGFALVLAILSLMLLTFLGLTLATTTSTELQIATNYRWSQQALYNAEAGLEAARVVLSRTADVTTQWTAHPAGGAHQPRVVASGRRAPPGRAGRRPGLLPLRLRPAGRRWATAACSPTGALRYENQSVFDGHALNGAFTIWVRRALVVDNAGQYSDDGTRQRRPRSWSPRASRPTPARATRSRAPARRCGSSRPASRSSLAAVGDPCLGA